MTVCARRDDGDEPGFWTPCSQRFDDHKCRCGEDVKGEPETAVGDARVPDSAREAT